MYFYNRVTLLYIWNQHNIVSQLYPKKIFLKISVVSKTSKQRLTICCFQETYFKYNDVT